MNKTFSGKSLILATLVVALVSGCSSASKKRGGQLGATNVC